MTQPLCPGCRPRDAHITKLERRGTEVKTCVRELRTHTGPIASNSSVPPSANPPSAPPSVVKHKTGGQPGYPLRRVGSDSGEDAAPARSSRAGVPPRVAGSSSRWPTYSEAGAGRMNGYQG